MLKILIIEDEQPAIDNLNNELDNIQVEYTVIKTLRSVKESIDWFKQKPYDIDLVFMDVQLSDGLSYHIFNTVEIVTPVIFITAHENHVMRSLEHNGIDYLLKPIDRDKLKQSIIKFNNLKKHFSITPNADLNQPGYEQLLIKDRITIKKGIEFQSIKAEDVAFFYTDHKLVFLVDKEGKKSMVHANNLTDLMTQLNRKIFFRANRKYIININFIKKYRAIDRVKLELELCITSSELVVISQENASSFRQWIESL